MKNFIKNNIPVYIRQIISPRDLNAICLGVPKSGTTMIAELFAGKYREGHEVERKSHVKVIYRHYKKEISDDFYVDYLKKRDKRLWLDLESNCFLGYRPELVYKAFPEFKYILSIREPLSWLDSIFNNNIDYPIKNGKTMERWHEFFFEAHKYEYHLTENILKKNLLYPVDAYLNYWLNANKMAIESIPESKLLILQTQNINQSIEKIACFLNVNDETILSERNHANKTLKKYNILAQLDSSVVNQKIQKVCGEFIQQHGLFK